MSIVATQKGTMFILTIKTEGAAFGAADPELGEAEGYGSTAEELSRILRRLADELYDTAPTSGRGTLVDLNGNSCGSWSLS